MIRVSRPLLGDEERAAVDTVLRSGHLAEGEQVAAFEREFSAVVGGAVCIAVSSGTSALHLGLLAAGVGQGDEVIVPSFTFAATANAVRLAGATPVFADIDPATFNLDPTAAAAAVGPRTAAVMPVHLYGQPARMPLFEALCQRHGLLLVEDAAQAHLARVEGRSVGTWGAFGAFSFYATKNMTTGEGGMIVTSDGALARTARLLRNQGMEKQYSNEIVGFNARMTDIAAAIGRVQLTKLPAWTAARQRHAGSYDAQLPEGVRPMVSRGHDHVYHQYTIRARRRDIVRARLKAEGVDTGIYYPVPVHRLPAYDLHIDLPHTTWACADVLSLPVGPHLSAAQVDKVAAVTVEAVASVGGV